MPQRPPPPHAAAATPAGAPGTSVAPATPFVEGTSWRWTDPHTWTITLEGEIDDHVITGLQQQIADALTGYDRVVIDLRGVRVLSTRALAQLCGALRRAYRPGATLTVSGAPPPARQALQACELPGVDLGPHPGHGGAPW